MKKWNLYGISESRSILMGLSTIMIVFFHCFSLRFYQLIPNEFIAKLFSFLRLNSNIGVDIFLFLSAVGLYFSLSKDYNVKSFYKKRVVRIIPAFLIVAIIYYIFEHVGILVLLRNTTLISFYLFGVRDFWFFALILPLYFLYPFLYKSINKYGIKSLLIELLIVIGLTFFIMYVFPSVYINIEIALTRIPVFLIGAYFGKCINSKKEINSLYVLLSLGLFIIFNYLLFNYKINPYIFVRYIDCILAISIIFMVSYLYSKKKIKIIEISLLFMGTYSLEVYLIFEKLSKHLLKVLSINSVILIYLIALFFTMILSIILKKVSNYISSKILGG